MNYALLKEFFETLTPNTLLKDFEKIYAKNVHFKDPFNDVVGIDAVYEVFSHMYRNLNEPKFVLNEYVQKENVLYIHWQFIFMFKNENKVHSFDGVSRLVLNEQGKIIEHIDYWDSAEHMYGKLPLIGSILRYIKRKIVRS